MYEPKKSIFKPAAIKELRDKLENTIGREATDKEFYSVLEIVENDLKKELDKPETKKAIANAFWNPLLRMAENNEVHMEIDGIDIGKAIREQRKKNIQVQK